MIPHGSDRMALRRMAALLLVLGALSLPASAPPSGAQVARPLSEAELLAIMLRAPAAPQPLPDGSAVELSEDMLRRMDSHVTAAGREVEAAARRGLAAGPPAARRAEARSGAGGTDEVVLAAGLPTMPGPIYDTMGPPWSMVAKLLARFDVDGVPHYYACSGALIGPFHVLTAAHCIFNWDPDGDGEMGGERWADEVWVWPAQTDGLAPIGVPERPFGDAMAVLNRAYEGWTVAHDIAWDIAILTLNRRIGDSTGWMALESGYPVTGLAFSGYPVEEPYVPRGTVVQYAGSDADNVTAYSTHHLQLSAYVYGGHSGGPVWRTGGRADECLLQGVLSVSDRSGYAAATLVTALQIDDFFVWMSTDYLDRKPVPRPDLCEYVLAPGAKALLGDSVRQGEAVGVTFNVLNSGAAESGPIAVDFYLSKNTSMSEQDVFVERRMLDSLAGNAFLVATTEITIPADAPLGQCYVGWLMRAVETEYSTVNNSALIGDQPLMIEVALTPTPTSTNAPEPTATATATASPEPTRVPACCGDCGGDLRVTVDELVRIVTIALRMAPLDDCPSGDANDDGQVTIAEVIASVVNALQGCAAETGPTRATHRARDSIS